MIKLFANSQILKKDELLTVFREGSVTYIDGKPRKNDIQKFQVRTNVQPMSGRDLLLVPEGDRHKEQYWLYFDNNSFTCDKGLDITGPSFLITNDRVVRQDVNYQVQSVENWGSFCKARIMRYDIGRQATP